MILRALLVFVGVAAAVVGCMFEAGALASAQSTEPPVIVVATIPPQPTPLPPLLIPREEFAEDASTQPDGTALQSPPPGSEQAAQLALASYGVVTVSIDEQNPANSAALIATPHGVVMKRVNELVDGYRVVAVNASGVTFAGGVVIPVGYSQQGSNPSVPPIGASFPAQRVPVNVNVASPAPVPAQTGVPEATPVPIRRGQQRLQEVSPFQAPPTPAMLNSQSLTPPPVVSPNNPAPSGSPQP